MASLKERKTMTLRGFRGIDYGSSPLEASSVRATDARNMMLENGVLQKRPGWRMIHDFSRDAVAGQTESKEIHGIQYWSGHDSPWRGWVVHMGNVLLFDCDSHGAGYDTYVKAGVSDEASTWIEQNGRLYIICGDIYVFPVTVNNKPVFKKLTELEDLYIPTTTININCEKESDTAVEVLESPSLFHPWRKNTLVARLSVCNEHKTYLTNINGEIQNYFTWNLDGKIKSGSKVTIVHQGTCYVNVSHKNSESIYIVQEKNFNQADFNMLTKPESYFSYAGFISHREDRTSQVNMSFGQCDHDGSASAVVTFCADYTDEELAERKRRITGCRVATLFGANGDTNRLFLSGNPDAPGRIFYSGFQRFDYFGDRDYVTAGDTQSEVNGFLRLSDNTMAVLKEPSREEFSLYYMTGTLENKYDSEGNLVEGHAAFYVANGGTDAACVSGRSALNLFGDALMLSRDGVVAVVLPTQTTIHRAVKERGYSLGIDKVKNLSGGHAIVYDGRYYLAVDDGEGSVLVADPKYKYTRQGNDVDQSFNYEWWHWDHIPAGCWYVFKGSVLDDNRAVPGEGYENTAKTTNGQNHAVYPKHQDQTLCFGTKDGMLCAFGTSTMAVYEMRTEGEYDNYYQYMFGHALSVSAQGQVVKTGQPCFYDQTDVQVSAGDLTVTGEREGIILPAALWDRIKTGDHIAVGGEGEGILVSEEGTDFSGVSLFAERMEGGWIRLQKTDRSLPIRWSAGTELQATEGTVHHYTPVRARWFTPYFDLGSNLYAKTLLGMSLTAGGDSGGLRFGYETRQNGEELIENRIYENAEGITLAYDFQPSAPLVQDFPASHTVRCHVRNFNYIRFGFVSEVPKPCTVHALSIYYKINQMNRWIR